VKAEGVQADRKREEDIMKIE
jgi:hypothetical protein